MKTFASFEFRIRHKKYIYKPPIGNGSLHEIIKNNGIIIMTLKNLLVKSTMFQYCKIHEVILTSADGNTINLAII
jgi:hypothetical protein